MGGGHSCPSGEEPVCPDVGEKSHMGGAHLGETSYHSETTSYVSVGLFNVYLTTTVTSSGVMLGFVLGVLISGGLMFGLAKRRKKLARKKAETAKAELKAVEMEQNLKKVLTTGTHSASWPPFRNPMPATAPPDQQPHQQSHLVPIAWGQ